MNDLPPRLAELLQCGPAAPTSLDATHRQAIQIAARQAWFRHRSRRRWTLLTCAAAAVLVAGVAGWTIRSLVEGSVETSTPIVASAPELMAKERSDPAALAPMAKSMPVIAEVETNTTRAGEGRLAEQTAQEPAVAMVAKPLEGRAASEAVAGDVPAEPIVAARSERRRQDAQPPAASKATKDAPASPPVMAPAPTAVALAAPAIAAAMSDAAPPSRVEIPTNTPRFGQLLAARATLEAAERGELAPAERNPALRAARDLIAGLTNPPAVELRARLDAALGTR